MIEPRVIHQKRNVQERIRDELTEEPMTKNPLKWLKDPLLVDFKCVDEPIADKFSVIFRNARSKVPNAGLIGNREEVFSEGIVTDRNTGKEVAEIVISCTGTRNCYIASLHTKPAYRGKCLSNHLLREITGIADLKGLELKIDAAPFEEVPITEEEVKQLAEWEKTGVPKFGNLEEADENDFMRLDSLIHYYEQFGFKLDPDEIGLLKRLPRKRVS